MQAFELIIDSKVKTSPFTIVSIADFEFHKGESVDPDLVLKQPNISLYCLDHENKQAIFVETLPQVDLFQAPFYFIAQYEAAQRLIIVPYDTLHMLARRAKVDPERIILFYSTGRCGSTLFSHVLNLNRAVVSFAEPDIFSQLVMLRTSAQGSDEEIASLLFDSVMIMSANAQQQGYGFYAFKFRSYVLSVSDLLYHSIPEAKLLFMYRNALTWARSFSRAFGAPTDSALETNLIQNGFRYMIPSVNIYLETHSHSISWLEYVARMWVSTMQDTGWLQEQGADIGYARFEDLKVAPRSVVESLLAHCDIELPGKEQLAMILAKDSQAGTAGAQNKTKPARWLTDDDLEKLEQIIQKIAPELEPNTILG